MHNVIVALLLLFTSAQVFAFESNYQDLLDEIVATEVPSAENEARLTALFEHQDQGVRVSAKIRIAELYWKTGRFEQAEAVLHDVSLGFDNYPPKYQVESLLTQASFESRRNNHREVEKYARRAAAIAKASHQPLLANTYYVLGNSLMAQRKVLAAKQHFELALAQYKEMKDDTGLLLTLNSLGVVHKDNGDLANGIKYLLQAREAVERGGSKGYRATVYYNLGDVFRDSHEPEKAASYYQQALEIDLELGDLGNVAYDYTGLAHAYSALEQHTKALQNNQKAIQQLVKIKAPQELSRAYLQQSRIYRDLADQTEQLKSLELAEKSAAQSQSKYQIMSVDIEKAKYSLEQQNYQQALTQLLKALAIADELSLEPVQLEVNKLLADVYQPLNDYQKANQHLSTSFALQQKLDNEDLREKSERYKGDLNLLEEQLKVSQLEQKEAEQAQAIEMQEAVKQRLVVMMLASSIVFIVLVIFLIQRRKLAVLKADLFEQALQQKQQLFADVSHELRTPLTALKLQIQALQYDLVSNVEDSYDKLAGKVNEINRLIADIYQLAQADTNAIELNQTEVELAPLFERWQADWQNTVESSGFAWGCQLALANTRKSIDSERIKQVIDNLLSNATVYTDKPGKIVLTATIENQRLVVSVEDTAPTVSEDKLGKIFARLYRVESSRSRQTGGSGLGLAICESLVKAHGGSIKAEQSELGGLKVSFVI
ncbi:tetratricopeptide repeat protein [Thalassotalea montiporae]